MVESALKQKLERFPKLSNKENKQLYELSDLLSEIESTKSDEKYSTLLSYVDSSAGAIPIVRKLPYNTQEKWTTQASKYKRQHNISFPPFSFFVEFVREVSRTKNDPSFFHESSSVPQTKEKTPTKLTYPRVNISSKKSVHAFAAAEIDQASGKCPIHKSNHCINECRNFRTRTLDDRKKFLKDHGICFRCCCSNKHMAKACMETVKCTECGSGKHHTALHVGNSSVSNSKTPVTVPEVGGETDQKVVNSNCTQICGTRFGGKSCSKDILVNVYPRGFPEQSKRMYAILDEQSNVSLARSKFFDLFNEDGETTVYSLTSCSGRVQTSGRRAKDYVIEALDSSGHVHVPDLVECDNIPNIRAEIPTPEVAMCHPHLKDIARTISPLDKDYDILLLIGRDVPTAHHIICQRIGPHNSPYAQKLRLGWVIVGETCLGKVHKPDYVVNKTYALPNGRPSTFEPCPSNFDVKEKHRTTNVEDSIAHNIFVTTPHDIKIGTSVEDREFLRIVDEGFVKGPDGNWVAPPPFKTPRRRLPNNKAQATKRAKTLRNSLTTNPVKRQHMFDFMQKIFDDGHAELAPPVKPEEECWEKIAFTADIERMFYCFQVREEDRNYLRFLWYQDNDFHKDLVDYRMKVHVFGNSPSPAVATYGLRKTAEIGRDNFGEDIVNFVNRDFYVDDALTSLPTVSETIDLGKRAQQSLATGGNIRLHKIVSNSQAVIQAFPSSDHAKDIKNLDLGTDQVPLQRSLGLSWDIKADSFTFQVSTDKKPFTRRGVLSTINSLFDPLGFVAPIISQGKILLREFMKEPVDWDDALPPHHEKEWEDWKRSLLCLQELQIPRVYTSLSSVSKEILIYSDASELAIAAVAYTKTTDYVGNEQIGFILGKAKLVPAHGHTIPRLELCATVLAVEIAETISDQLDIDIKTIRYFTDSNIVLGYLNNQTRRFYIYVSNRVERVRRVSTPGQSSYISTELNPADVATRNIAAADMKTSVWLIRPSKSLKPDTGDEPFELCSPEDDHEIRPQVTSLDTNVSQPSCHGSERFQRYSFWNSLVRAVSHLKHIVRSYGKRSGCRGWHVCRDSKNVDLYRETELVIITQLQSDVFSKEIDCVNNRDLPKNSSIRGLSSILDEDGMLRVGGRLNRASIPVEGKNPIIIPGKQHIAMLLVRHYHQAVLHQGRHFTEGAVRAAGFWIIGCKRLISSLCHQCVKCRKLRATTSHQKMADFPPESLTPAPAFTYVGVDTFGHRTIVTRRTRGGAANSKRWAIMFSCLVTRAVHIEVVEDMSSASFINALRRFQAIRGSVNQFRSDRGTNFVGATDDIGIDAINVEDEAMGGFLHNREIEWIFNPRHSSHMGGSWERMIGVTRRILNSMMADVQIKNLTHDVLVTFMAEICAILNARPLVPVSNDPDSPFILTPNTLLTQKVGSSVEPLCDTSQRDQRDICRSLWKRVQLLADIFWKRWRNEYIQTLQPRRKWQDCQPNIKKDDVVLLKDKSVHRNEWPMGIVLNTIPGTDDRVRKAVVRVVKKDQAVSYTRPVTEMVRLLSND